MTMTRTPTNAELVAARKAQSPSTPAVPAVVTPKPATAVMAAAERSKDTEAAIWTRSASIHRWSHHQVLARRGLHHERRRQADRRGRRVHRALRPDRRRMAASRCRRATIEGDGLLYDGYEVPPRKSLGDLNQAEWDEGIDGKPADPWQHVMMLVLQDTKTSEMFTFSTSSRTGRRAVANLLRHFDRMQKLNPNELPVVRLARGGFKHRDPRVGFVNVPTFIVCGRQKRDDASVPDTSIGNYLNDEIKL